MREMFLLLLCLALRQTEEQISNTSWSFFPSILQMFLALYITELPQDGELRHLEKPWWISNPWERKAMEKAKKPKLNRPKIFHWTCRRIPAKPLPTTTKLPMISRTPHGYKYLVTYTTKQCTKTMLPPPILPAHHNPRAHELKGASHCILAQLLSAVVTGRQCPFNRTVSNQIRQAWSFQIFISHWINICYLHWPNEMSASSSVN